MYGPGMLFAAQMFGIFGVPIPDELLLTIAGALVREGKLNGFWTAVAAVSGCLCGVTLSYTLGRTVGITALRRIVRVPDSAFDRAQRWFHRIGRWLLTFGYFIPGVRHCTAIAAGSAPLSYREFALFCYSGGVLWCAVFLSLGYITGPHWRRAWQHASRPGAVRVRAALRRACAGAVFQLAADAAGHHVRAASAGLKPQGTAAFRIARSDRPRSTDEAPRESRCCRPSAGSSRAPQSACGPPRGPTRSTCARARPFRCRPRGT